MEELEREMEKVAQEDRPTMTRKSKESDIELSSSVDTEAIEGSIGKLQKVVDELEGGSSERERLERVLRDARGRLQDWYVCS